MESKLIQNHTIPTAQRVPESTSDAANERIRQRTLQRLKAVGDNPAKIRNRLREIDREWDIERTLEANASALSLLGLGLGAVKSRAWFLLPLTVSGFLLQHALRGWCPPLPLFRRLGVRTQREIDSERTILLARLGELDSLQHAAGAENALRAIE